LLIQNYCFFRFKIGRLSFHDVALKPIYFKMRPAAAKRLLRAYFTGGILPSVDKTFQNVPLLPVGKPGGTPIEIVPMTGIRKWHRHRFKMCQ